MGKKVVRNSSVINENSITAEELFTDREEPRKAFWDIYDSLGESEYEVLAFYGVGGVGKSTLLKKLGREMEEKVKNGKLDYVYYSFECEPTKEEFLYSLSRKMMMRNKGLSFPILDTAIAKLAEEGKKDLALLEEKGQSIFESEYAQLAASVAGEYLPWVGTITQAAGSVVKIGNKIKSDWEKEKGANRNVYSDIAYNDGKRAIENLHEFFVKDVFDVFEKRTKPFVIFLDGYEHFVNRVKDGDKAELVDHWMYNEDNGLIYIPNTIWVISGRNAINWPEDVLSRDNSHRIGDLSEEDTLLFFKKAGIKDDELAKGLYKITGGTPAFLDLCVKRYNSVVTKKSPELRDFGHNTETLAQRYLESMDSSKQAVIKMLSCFPNIWKVNMAVEIAEILGYGNIKIILDDILPLSIFEKYPEGYRLHETVRKVVKDNTSNSTEINKTILGYIKNQILVNKPNIDMKYLLSELCIYLEAEDSCSVSQEEIITIVDILKKYVDLNFEYNWFDNCLLKILDYCAKHEFDYEVLYEIRFARTVGLIRSKEYEKALTFAMETSVLIYEQQGKEDVYYLESLLFCVDIFVICGKYMDAKKLLDNCYEIVRVIYADKSPMLIINLSSIASSYMSINDYEKAAELYEECYLYSLDKSGEEDSDTLEYLAKLAECLLQSGKSEQAISYAEKCYGICKRMKGEARDRTLSSLSCLSGIYLAMGRINESLDIAKKVYEINKNKFGERHYDTLVAHKIVSSRLSLAGQYDEAIDIGKECYELCKEIYGEEHVATIDILKTLGSVYESSKDYSKAISILEKCFNWYKDNYEEGHLETLECLSALAECYYECEDYEKAEELYRKCHNISIACNGELNGKTLYYFRQRLWATLRVKDYENVVHDAYKCLLHCQYALGEENEDTMSVYKILYYGYMYQHDYHSALSEIEKYYNISKAIFGENHPTTINGLFIMGNCYGWIAESNKKIEAHEKCYELSKETFGENSIYTLDYMFNLAEDYSKLRKNDRALELMTKCLELRKKLLGEDHSDTIQCVERISKYTELKDKYGR